MGTTGDPNEQLSALTYQEPEYHRDLSCAPEIDATYAAWPGVEAAASL
jgi:hypothetical protein